MRTNPSNPEAQPARGDVRRRVLELVGSHPGLHLSRIARRAGTDVNLARYHLRCLERKGLVSSLPEGGYLRFFPRVAGALGPCDVLDVRAKRVLAVLRRETPRRVAETLLERGTLSQVALSEILGLAPSTVHHHVSRMENAGIVVRHRSGRARVCALVDPTYVREILAKYAPAPALLAALEGPVPAAVAVSAEAAWPAEFSSAGELAPALTASAPEGQFA